MSHENKRAEFGDFQTPQMLAERVVVFLVSVGFRPDVVVEPTCGLGAFVRAAHAAFPAALVHARDINPKYVEKLRTEYENHASLVHVEEQDFFVEDWKSFFQGIKGEILVLGNPPWVTNSSIGTFGGKNLPLKSNFQNHQGFAAKTGKANFDISEWMLIKILEALGTRRACVAMLCKTATARKVIKHAWLNRFPVGELSLHVIDAQAHFGVAVDACLMVAHTGSADISRRATVYRGLSLDAALSTFGLQGKDLVANVDEYLASKDLEGISHYTWRSGVKHDAARVMELQRDGNRYRNGLNEPVEIEEAYLYALLKSSDLANGALNPRRYVLLTQRNPNDDTGEIEQAAPQTWRYLLAHGDVLDARRSSIYQKRPRFAVFGVGGYTFAPWKVAISGLYKSLRFRVVGPCDGKPVVFDDTCYFVPCQTQREANLISELLNSDICQRFLYSLVFFDAKRPVTVDILSRVDLKRIAERLGFEAEAASLLANATRYENAQTLMVYEAQESYGPASANATHKNKHTAGKPRAR